LSAVARRLAAILAADVVGFSRLMGADEAGTLERLKALRRELVQPKIAERSGRIVKLMGDGLLAEFPSVVEAVLCAVELQQDITAREPDLADERRIRLRIGINLGDVMVEGSDIYGDWKRSPSPAASAFPAARSMRSTASWISPSRMAANSR
jgi:class 3 adenylate cyclase